MALDYNRFAGGLLSSLGSGLMSAGSQGGWNNFAPGFAQGQQQFDQQQYQQQTLADRQKMQALQEQQIQMQLEAQRTANQDKVKQQQAMEKLLGGGLMSPNGMSQAQFGGAPENPGMMSQNFNPEQLQFLQALPPEQSSQILGQTLFAKPDPVKPNSDIAQIQADLTAGFITPEQAQAAIKKATYIAPQQPPATPADIQEYLYAKSQGFNGTIMDYKASLKGQGMSVTLPDGTTMQVGGAMKPPTEAQQTATSRAQLFKDGMDGLQKLADNPDIGAWNMAGAETAEMFGPLGRVVGGKMRTSAEKQWAASQASALEGLAASVTGAGVTTDQFTRYTSMLPQATDDVETRKAKLKSANDFLSVQLTNAGAAGQALLKVMKGDKPVAPIIGTVDGGYKFKGGDPADPKNWEAVQ